VLDAGCGDGRLAADIARTFPRAAVLGLDEDPDALRRARETAAEVASLTVRAGAIGGPRLGATFDLVVCVDVLEHIPDDRAAIEWLVAHVGRGGWLAIHVPATGQRHWLPHLAESVLAEIAAGVDAHVREGYGKAELQELIAGPEVRVCSVQQTFHQPMVQLAADVDTWLFRNRASPLKAALLPALLAASVLERAPSSSARGNGMLLLAQRVVTPGASGPHATRRGIVAA